jgi:methionyl-tRNA formyltransferase
MTGKDLRLVFMGTPEFACESLKALTENGYNVEAVVTVPDKPAGRGQKITQSEVKQFALKHGIPLLQPEKLKDESFITDLRSFKADLQVVVAFRMLPEIVWNMPPFGTINLHASLLPLYRGAAPLNWPIINGDSETGVTTFLLRHEIDTGHILFQEKISIGSEDNVGVIHDRLMVLGAKLVLKTVDALAEGNVNPVPQESLIIDPERLHAPKIFKENCKIDWEMPGPQINNLIRGLSPYPAAWTNLAHADNLFTLKILGSSFEPALHTYPPGHILSDKKKYIKIAVRDGFILIKDLQLAGKKRMPVADFLRGFPNPENFEVR